MKVCKSAIEKANSLPFPPADPTMQHLSLCVFKTIGMINPIYHPMMGYTFQKDNLKNACEVEDNPDVFASVFSAGPEEGEKLDVAGMAGVLDGLLSAFCGVRILTSI